ncbi:MAG: DUF4352 domain-containing protein [Firmicutes bacterium]|nr:DUF4352 domain-containing protein [Bacillota bacterium]
MGDHRRFYLAGVSALLLAAGLLVGCGSTTTPVSVNGVSSSTQQEKPASSPTVQQQTPKHFAIGDHVKMGDLVLTVNSARQSSGSEFDQPQSGHVYEIVNATLENTGQKSEAISSLAMFSLKDSEGYKYSITFVSDAKGQLDGELAPGDKMRGELAFEIPKTAKGLQLLFEPNIVGFGQAVIDLTK